MATTEGEFKLKVFKVLRTFPRMWFFKTQLVAIVGIPDVIGVCNGHFFAWELKKEDGKASKVQLSTLKKINKAGGTAHVVRPSNLDDCANSLMRKAFPQRIENA